MKKKNNRRIRMNILMYSAAAAFCLLFGTVYEHFSHGVYSPYMYLAFLVPLVLGTIPGLVIMFTGCPYPAKLSVNMYASGVATLTVGSIMQGVLEIYGTTNRLMIIYLIAGIVLLVVGMVSYAVSLIKWGLKRPVSR